MINVPVDAWAQFRITTHMITKINRKLFFDIFFSVLIGVICSYLLVVFDAYATAYFPFSYQQILPESRTLAKYVFMLIQLVLFWLSVLFSVGVGSVILGVIISDKVIFKGTLLALTVIGSWTFWMYGYDYGDKIPDTLFLPAEYFVEYLFKVLIVVITACFSATLAFKIKR